MFSVGPCTWRGKLTLCQLENAGLKRKTHQVEERARYLPIHCSVTTTIHLAKALAPPKRKYKASQ